MSAQLPLNIQLRDDAKLENFYPADNSEVLQAVTKMSQGLGEPFLYCWGQEGVGRTHLLQATCQAAEENGMNAVYIPLQAQSRPSHMMLQGIEELPLVCIDDIDQITGQPLWEEALFHFFNRIRAQEGRLLISASVSPSLLKIALPDLKSRLGSGITYQLHRLNDEQKIEMLQRRALQRGLQLNKIVAGFLLNRCSRSMSELFATLEKLDRASLAEQRRLTIPFVKHILEI